MGGNWIGTNTYPERTAISTNAAEHGFAPFVGEIPGEERAA